VPDQIYFDSIFNPFGDKNRENLYSSQHEMAPSATSIQDVVMTKSKLPLVPLEGAEDHDLVLRTFRVLIADLVQHFNGGHPGYVETLSIFNGLQY